MGSLLTRTMKYLRVSSEHDPILAFSIVIGTVGVLGPFLLGDGGRSAEEANTSYAYRIKHVYPKGGASS